MIAFDVQDMTCGHCVNAVTKAVRKTDNGASVSVNLDTKRVQINSPLGNTVAFEAAIREAGYHPVQVTNALATAPAPAAARATGCCGSRR
ncbi:heavy-metal-associated domain-containing protein [Rhizobacter sp. LjRoot28]|uniref:heavy-metal-associated domain-containing protein n=1 Tax=Rhizobacter sp. LjRoot28 TaxID=3342309 RepID=UPI003ECD259C